MTTSVLPSSAPAFIFQRAHEIIEELPEILRPVCQTAGGFGAQRLAASVDYSSFCRTMGSQEVARTSSKLGLVPHNLSLGLEPKPENVLEFRGQAEGLLPVRCLPTLRGFLGVLHTPASTQNS